MPLYKVLSLIAPRYLSYDRRLSAADKAFQLQLIADGVGTISMHAERMGVSYYTARRAAMRLVDFGWAEEVPAYRVTHIAPTLPLEVEQRAAEMLASMREKYQPVGEFLLKCILCLLIPDRNYHDNVRLPSMVDGKGSGRFELDRLYDDLNLAFEYQGRQHFQTGGPLKITNEELEKQMNRDQIKAALCAKEGIHLFWFTIDDLSISRVRERLQDTVPLRPIRENRPLARTVERIAVVVVDYAMKNDT